MDYLQIGRVGMILVIVSFERKGSREKSNSDDIMKPITNENTKWVCLFNPPSFGSDLDKGKD